MAEEPRNAASQWARRMIASLNDNDFVEREGLSVLSPNFVRYDRRHMTPQPPADRETWRANLFVFEELAGDWPRQRVTEVIAVRGDRVVAFAVEMGLGDLGEIEFIIVSRVDEELKHGEISYYFDRTDLHTAIAELDRLHTELGGD